MGLGGMRMALSRPRLGRPPAPATPTSARLRLRVTPNAKRSQATAYRDGVLFVKVAAPPRDGKANVELLKFLKSLAGVTPRILHGESGRDKWVEFPGVSDDVLRARLQSVLPGESHG